jgi:hypothetical protein
MNPTFTTPDPRDAALLAMRPVIAAEPQPAGETTAGAFLHATLRPVLKLQNAPLLQAVADFMRDHHVPLAALSAADQQRQLTELLSRNLKLRYTVVGLITGLFTAAEYGFYRAHRSEVNRRLHELALRRVLDQTAQVVRLAAIITPR